MVVIAMDIVEILTKSFWQLLMAIACFSYIAYMLVKQKVHVRGVGLKSKEEAPKTYFFMLGFCLLVAIFSLAMIVLRIIGVEM